MKKLLRAEDGQPLYQWFHQNSRLSHKFFQHQPPKNFPLFPPLKKYSFHPVIELPLEQNPPEATLVSVILDRKSVREFDSVNPLTLEQLAGILRYSYGVTHRIGPVEFRAAASAGGRYPIEIYVAVNQVVGLSRGLYHYDVHGQALMKLGAHDCSPGSWGPPGSGNDAVLATANCVLVFSAIFPRSIDKYGDRGYRYVMMDAGHLSENVYLCATAYNVGAVGIGGFYEDPVEQELGIDGVNEGAIYLMALGAAQS